MRKIKKSKNVLRLNKSFKIYWQRIKRWTRIDLWVYVLAFNRHMMNFFGGWEWNVGAFSLHPCATQSYNMGLDKAGICPSYFLSSHIMLLFCHQEFASPALHHHPCQSLYSSLIWTSWLAGLLLSLLYFPMIWAWQRKLSFNSNSLVNSFVLLIQIKILNIIFKFCLVLPLPDPIVSSHSALAMLQPHFVFVFFSMWRTLYSCPLWYFISIVSIPFRWLFSWVLFPIASSHRPTSTMVKSQIIPTRSWIWT